MKRLVLLAAVIAGCNGGTPTSFGLNVTVDAHGVASGDLVRITSAKLTVTGAEQYTKSFDISSAIKSAEVRFRYIPEVKSGQLTLAIDALDPSANVIASGISDAVDVVNGKSVSVRLVLGETSMDLGTVDAGDDGGTNASDMSHIAKGQGAACITSAECTTVGGCVDGYCCDTTCTDGCKACNLSGKEGVCSPVPAGSAPTTGHSSCGPDPKNGCQRDGTCDGAGACRKWALGTVCQPGTCNSTTNQSTSDSTCDGSGSCKPGTTITCAPYVCKDTSVCWPACTDSGQCSSGNFCNGSSCGKKALGTMCGSAAECQNGMDGSSHCVDGVCCDTACNGTCQYCALSASKGTCSLVPAGADPRGVCPPGPNTICAPGGCTGTTMACRIAAQNTPCAGGCSSNIPSNTTCNATGSCNQTSTGSACGAYLCVVGAGSTEASCTTNCNSDGDCDQPNYGCDTTTHACALVNGKGCTSGSDCASGACAPEGICCDAPCTGQCQYCDTTGKCQFSTGAPHAPRQNCTADSGYPICSGSCDGVSAGCGYPTVGCQGCFPPGGGNPFNYEVCSGTCSNGTCNANCTICGAGYQCGKSPFTGNDVCFNSCSAANQSTNCASGYSCVNGMCQ